MCKVLTCINIHTTGIFCTKLLTVYRVIKIKYCSFVKYYKSPHEVMNLRLPMRVMLCRGIFMLALQWVVLCWPPMQKLWLRKPNFRSLHPLGGKITKTGQTLQTAKKHSMVRWGNLVYDTIRWNQQPQFIQHHTCFTLGLNTILFSLWQGDNCQEGYWPFQLALKQWLDF